MKTKNIAIFGGSFDPLHNGHMEIVRQSLKQLNIKQLIIIPTYISIFKSSYDIEPIIRYKMLKRTFSSYKKVIVSDIEQNKKKAVSTYESMMFLRKKLTPKNIYIIVGAENIENIEKWVNYKKLSSKTTFVVAPRGNIKMKRKNKYIILNFKNKNSSSEIKEKNNNKHIPTQARITQGK